MGEMLAATERHPAGPDKRDRSHRVTDPVPSLADLGLAKRESAEAQAELESHKTRRDRAKLAVDAREIKARIACVECVQGVEAGRAVSYPYPGPFVRARV
jgi:hypothetical protein